MAKPREPYLALDWNRIDDCPDLERVKRVLENLPDEPLMRLLESRRMGRPACGGRACG